MTETATVKDQLLARIADRSAVIGVIGLGYVGLPLAMEFVQAGFTVIGYDVSQRVVDLLMAGQSHIQDIPAATVHDAVAKGRFVATAVEDRLRECEAISIAVPTPLSKTRDPDMAYVLSAADAIARQAHPGLCVVLESTTYPGTTRELLQPRLEAQGLIVGRDIFVAFSPERVDPGNPVYHTKNTPKVVGGITPACVEVATALYESCIDIVVPVSSPEAAELVKLLENTFRAVNIGLVNEIAIVCDKLGVNVWEVIDAAATKPFGFMKFTPGPGIGGHCIPLDPHYLAWKMRRLNYKTGSSTSPARSTRICPSGSCRRWPTRSMRYGKRYVAAGCSSLGWRTSATSTMSAKAPLSTSFACSKSGGHTSSSMIRSSTSSARRDMSGRGWSSATKCSAGPTRSSSSPITRPWTTSASSITLPSW